MKDKTKWYHQKIFSPLPENNVDDQFTQILGKESDYLNSIHDFLHDYQRLTMLSSRLCNLCLVYFYGKLQSLV